MFFFERKAKGEKEQSGCSKFRRVTFCLCHLITYVLLVKSIWFLYSFDVCYFVQGGSVVVCYVADYKKRYSLHVSEMFENKIASEECSKHLSIGKCSKLETKIASEECSKHCNCLDKCSNLFECYTIEHNMTKFELVYFTFFEADWLMIDGMERNWSCKKKSGGWSYFRCRAVHT